MSITKAAETRPTHQGAIALSHRDTIILCEWAMHALCNSVNENDVMLSPHDPVGSAKRVTRKDVTLRLGQTYIGGGFAEYIAIEAPTWRFIIATKGERGCLTTYFPARRLEGDLDAFHLWYAAGRERGMIGDPELLADCAYFIRAIVRLRKPAAVPAVADWLAENATGAYIGHAHHDMPILWVEFADENDAFTFHRVIGGIGTDVGAVSLCSSRVRHQDMAEIDVLFPAQLAGPQRASARK